MTRRAAIRAGGAALIAGLARIGIAAPTDARDRFRALEAEIGGRLGVAAVDTATGRQVAYRGSERFAMCSTFKWLLAAAVLAEVDRGALSLDRRLPYGAANLLDVSPVTTSHVSEGSLPVEVLCEAAVTVSDNTAANLLLEAIGGPASLTAFLRRSGDHITRLDRSEPMLNTNYPHDPRDTTSPEAMIETMRRLLVADALSSRSKELLNGWLKGCRTGLTRLRAGLPGNWVVGDKTGTGDRGATNDNAIAWPPGRAPVLIAAYLSGSGASQDALNVTHARIAGIVVASLG